ncbi:MAG: mitochondrial fission ELM1 family protein, partial [Rhodospirillales bacterium]|nr:mitochondrial fission ELM1 family protein [Rhodospirillales bacterium]
MTEARHSAQRASGTARLPRERVWVLDDPRAGTSAQTVGIAERLGVPFRRMRLSFNWMAHIAGLARQGSLLGLPVPLRRTIGAELPEQEPPGIAADGPRLVISAGRRSAAVALWLKARFGCRNVHCMSPGLGGLLRTDIFDLLVIPAHDNPPAAPTVMPVLGAPHRVSPTLLAQARVAWQERLGHLPHPRIALLVGGPVRGADLAPALAHRLGRHVARLAA